jgi:type I restriction enzyme R subunit
MITDINSEDRLVQKTFAGFLKDKLGWESLYAWNEETFGPTGTLGRKDERDTVLTRDLHAALTKLNPQLNAQVVDQAMAKLTGFDFSRSMVQHNQEFYDYIRNGIPVGYRDGAGNRKDERARVINYKQPADNRFLCVRELKIRGLRVPHYNRRADLVCFVNGLPLVFIELKAVYRNIRSGFEDNLTDYMTEQVIPHAFYHNAFVIVSNGEKAKFGSITSAWDHFAEWKRLDETGKGSVDAKILLEGMLSKENLLDIVENFILFDASRPGGLRKIVARNQQFLGVNNAVASVIRQEELKKQFPIEQRLVYTPRLSLGEEVAETPSSMPQSKRELEPIIKRAHPDLGRLGVFWHTQGSGKSYSMAFFVEKVRRTVPVTFTFLLLTDRDDLETQIYNTFAGAGIANKKTPRASSGRELEALLKQNHRFIFTLIQKFRREEMPKEAWSLRDDVIVISDEAHRTQAGKLARIMRTALPNASFIGFTGTPILKHDNLTKRIFGGYISTYDFRMSEEDGNTVRLVYENRGEKLGLARPDLNDRIAEAVMESELDDDQVAKLEKLLGKDYEIITADERLDKLAEDFVEHIAGRWDAGKAMFVCVDKITCGRMHKLIMPKWEKKTQALRQELDAKEAFLEAHRANKDDAVFESLVNLRARVEWLETTKVAMIISESQNEVRDFRRWDIDIVPHREIIKNGFETPDGKRVDAETAFKDAQHPFRVAIVCAMWLTGFDVEALSAMYIDKPMKAHNLMQAIARANRIYPGKDCGLIVDYNGMLKSLREALADYAIGGEGSSDDSPVTPIEELVALLEESIVETEAHLLSLGFDIRRLAGAVGFDRIEAIKDAVDACYTDDHSKRRYEIMARQVFSRMKTVSHEPASRIYHERHDNIETIYKKLQENRDFSDVTELLKSLHRIVNEAIRTSQVGDDHAEGIKIDLSEIDFEKLKEEFTKKVHRKHIVLEMFRAEVERRLGIMLKDNPLRMDYYKKYSEIIADYNREKDRSTVEATFAALMKLAAELDEEQKRAVREGLTEDELSLFDLLFKVPMSKVERERVKQASKHLLAALKEHLASMKQFYKTERTQADVETFIRNKLTEDFPIPPYAPAEILAMKSVVYEYVVQRAMEGSFFAA